MNGYIILAIIAMLIIGILGWVFMTANEIVKATILFMGLGAGVMFAIWIAWDKKLYETLYPIKVRAYGVRYDGFSVTDDTRAKIVKDKKTGKYEALETPSGKRFKMVDRKYIMRGIDLFADLFDTKDQQFPITIKMSKDEMDAIEKKIIPEDQRVWFADQAIPAITEATKPPLSSIAAAAVIISIIGVAVMFAMGFALGPSFLIEMQKFWNGASSQIYGQLDAQHKAFIAAVKEAPIVVRCESTGQEAEPIEPPA